MGAAIFLLLWFSVSQVYIFLALLQFIRLLSNHKHLDKIIAWVKESFFIDPYPVLLSSEWNNDISTKLLPAKKLNK